MTIPEQLECHVGVLRLSELAEILHLSYDCIYDWVTKCHLPATKINGTYWIDPQLAARWWRAHSTTPPDRKKERRRGN